MGLIPAIISGACAIISAAVAKIIADDAKEWTPWVTGRLLDIAVLRLPESQRERYTEEWAAHLAEVPGVVGKLAASLQFQIAAFGVRELCAKARLDAWRNERAAVLAEIQPMVGKALALMEARGLTDEADKNTLEEHTKTIRDLLTDFTRRCNEIVARRPALGITVAGATFMADRSFSMARAEVMMTTVKARIWPMSTRGSILLMLGLLKELYVKRRAE